MLFLLATPEYNKVQINTTKVKVHLRTGIAEIFDQHQDLMGKVENNIVEIETNFENKLEKFLFILQDAVFIVSTKGLDEEYKGTGIYIYAKSAREINSSFSIEDLSKQYEQKKTQLETQLELVAGQMTTSQANILNSKILLLKDDVEFLRKALLIVKGLK
jgi:F0F1-type ATP synthase epsilon subunit